MKRFDYIRVTNPEQACKVAHSSVDANSSMDAKSSVDANNERANAQDASFKASQFIAGGTNLLDLMKLEIEAPIKLIDINRLELSQVDITKDGGLRIGTLVTNSDLAAHSVIITNYPVLSRAILAGASGQLRNKATTGGNFLQRTRCYYFYQTDSACNKRNPGSGCPAISGENRSLAILGTSDACIAQHPSDMAVAMRALDAKIQTLKADGRTRTIDVKEFYRLPKDTPHIETVLEHDELITHIILPPPIKGMHTYDKVRDRASYAFALVSCASIIDVDDEGILQNVRLAFGGIGVMPWRNEAVEEALIGTKGSVPDIVNAANILLADARGRGQNDFKIPLTRRLLKQVIQRALDAKGA